MSNPLDTLVSEQLGNNTQINNAITRRKALATQIKQASIAMPVQLANQLNDTLNAFWGSEDPQKLSDELDKETPGFTAQLFQYHAELAAFLGAKVPSLVDKLAKRPDTYNVVIDPVTKKVTITEKE